MQEQKTRPDTGDVAVFIAGLDDPAQRVALAPTSVAALRAAYPSQ
jgi:hypothetical protein